MLKTLLLFVTSLLFLTTAPAQDPARVLAQEDTRSDEELDDSRVKEYVSVLDRLDGKCQEDEEQLATIAINARDELRRSDVEETTLNILKGADEVTAEDSVEQAECVSVVTQYILLREVGQDHEKAKRTLAQIEAKN